MRNEQGGKDTRLRPDKVSIRCQRKFVNSIGANQWSAAKPSVISPVRASRSELIVGSQGMLKQLADRQSDFQVTFNLELS
jgi:hypothetical protein